MALNLICVDETTRQTVDIPIRPRSIKEMRHEVHRKPFHTTDVINFDSNSKIKQRLDRSDNSVKPGNKRDSVICIK